MRRAVALLGVVGVAFMVPAAARATSNATVVFGVDRHVVRFGHEVTFGGQVADADSVQQVGVIRRVENRKRLVISDVTVRADGTFTKAIPVRTPGAFFARARVTDNGDQKTIASAERTVAVRPILKTRWRGSRTLGRTAVIRGRVVPRAAGTLKRTARGRTRTIRLSARGYFRTSFRLDRPRDLSVRLAVVPRARYRGTTRRMHRDVVLPYLGYGSHGRAVRILERYLAHRQYALPRVNRSYTLTTVQAVWAFQKVHGLARTGRVGPRLWRKIGRSHRPRAILARGSHIEISKSRQVIFEVRRGKVVNVLHTSTGATGNTPVGKFHVYWKSPGYNALGMYYSMYFLRGFAVHGYHSVPPYPASHGCARIPIWAARGLYYRWGVGTTVRVFG